jgi:hypothetical protein
VGDFDGMRNSCPSSYLSLYHGVGDAGAARDKLQLYLVAEPGGFSTPEWELGGLIFPGTTQQLTVWGTVNGTTINPDGSVMVFVDGSLQVSLTGKKIGTTAAFGGGTLKKVHVNPMGRFDNFKACRILPL